MAIELKGCTCKYCGHTWAASELRDVCYSIECQKQARMEAQTLEIKQDIIGEIKPITTEELEKLHLGRHPIFSHIDVKAKPEKPEKSAEKDTSVLNNQIAGDHYKKLGDYQPWQVADKWLTDDEFRGAAKLTMLAYLCRERDKGGIEDIRKAVHTGQIFLELWDKRQVVNEGE